MTSKIRIIIKPESSVLKENVLCTIYFDDPAMIGCKAKYTIETNVIVKSDNGVDKNIIHLTKKFKIQSLYIQFDIRSDKLIFPSYNGIDIDIISQVHVVIEDKNFKGFQQTKIINRQGANKTIHDNKGIMKTEKKISIFNSIKMLPKCKQTEIIKTILIGSTISVIFLFFGIHDFWVGFEKSYIYRMDFGHYHLIFIITIMSLIYSMAIINDSIKKNLSNWIKASINKKKLPKYFNKNSYCRLSDLLQSKTLMEIDKIKIQISVCNFENGMYFTSKRGINGKYKTVAANFNTPVREFVLYNKTLKNISKGENIEKQLDDKIYFKQIYEYLYPKNMLSIEYGINYYWKVQLIHDNFIDCDVSLPTDRFIDKDFY